MLEYLCKEDSKVIRSSSEVMAITMTTTKNTTASGMIAAVRLGKSVLQGNGFYCPHAEGMGKVLFSPVSVCSQGGVSHLHSIILLSSGPMSFQGWGYRSAWSHFASQ